MNDSNSGTWTSNEGDLISHITRLNNSAKKGDAEDQAKLWDYLRCACHKKQLKWIKKATWIAKEKKHRVEALFEKAEKWQLQDKKGAFNAYLAASILEDFDAYFHVAECYENGSGVRADAKEALIYYKKSAGKNNAEAYYRMGRIKEEMDEDEEAKSLYKKAISFGYTRAQDDYERLISKSQTCESDVGFEMNQAVNGNAIVEGEESTENELKVQHDYMGECVKYMQSAEKGHAEAQYNMGMYHELGLGGKVDLLRAFDYFKRAAEQGGIDACYKVGVYYMVGDGVDYDEGLAFEWLKKAADAGHTDAAYRVGLSYLGGKGVSHDAAAALPYLEIAAMAGGPEAMYLIACCYEEGQEVAGNLLKALIWYEKAAEAGIKEAVETLISPRWIIRKIKFADIDHGHSK